MGRPAPLGIRSSVTPVDRGSGHDGVMTWRRLLPGKVGALALLLTSPAALAQTTFQLGPPAVGRGVAQGKWTVVQVDLPSHVPQLRVRLTPQSGTEADLYLRADAAPTLLSFDHASRTPGTSSEELIVNGTTGPALRTGTWYIGVWHSLGTTFGLEWHKDVVPASHSGIGADVFDDGPGNTGTRFRVWAPHATQVALTSDFNGWSGSLAKLADEGDGSWSLDYRDLPAGAQYRYVLTTPYGTLWKNDPRARELTSSAGNGVVIDPEEYDWSSSGYSAPAWNDLVIYELHLGTFSDIPGGPPGSLSSAKSRLDYLADLGVNAVELMPLWEFPGDYSWGYNGSYPFSVETAYGGADALRAFVDAAHERGIAVLLDLVYNHWGPTDLDLWRFDGWSQGVWGGIYFYNDERAETPWGDTKPDFGKGEVRQYIRDNAISWLVESRIDGARWDGTSQIRMGSWGDQPEGWSLMQWINDEVDASQPWKIQIAEDMYASPNHWITKDTGAGGAGFDGQWDALFVHPIREAVIAPDDASRNMWSVRDAIAHRYNSDSFERVIYTESHDEVANGKSRVPEEIWPGNAGSYYSKKRSTLAASIALTSPGIPMLFQGQELLEDGYFQDTDPVDWSKLTTYAGIHQLYKDLIALRRNMSGSSQGLRGQHVNVHHVNDWDKVIAYHRWDQGGPGDDVVVLCNFKNQAWNDYRIGLPTSGTWKVRFNSDWSGYDTSFGDHPTSDVQTDAIAWDGMSQSASLSFGPYTTIILSQ